MTQQTGIYHVELLRTAEEINEMKLAIKRGNKGTPKRPKLAHRDVLIFLMGINTGLRVNDLVRLKVRDVKVQDILTIREGKTYKQREINVEMLREEIQAYIADKQPVDYLFTSQKGSKAITTTQVYRILTDAADYLGRSDIGTQDRKSTRLNSSHLAISYAVF